jgi:hypothetical protein
MRKSIDDMRQSWGDIATMPETTRRATGDGCKAAADAVAQSAQAIGCTL